MRKISSAIVSVMLCLLLALGEGVLPAFAIQPQSADGADSVLSDSGTSIAGNSIIDNGGSLIADIATNPTTADTDIGGDNPTSDTDASSDASDSSTDTTPEQPVDSPTASDPESSSAVLDDPDDTSVSETSLHSAATTSGDMAIQDSLQDSESSSPQSLVVGDTFKENTDEGIRLLYKITSDCTVQVGTGKALPFGSLDYTATPDFTGTISIPESVQYGGVTYSVTSIADYAFYPLTTGLDVQPYCLSAINLPDTITSIGSYAFSRCGLNSFTFPISVTMVGTNTFQDSSGLGRVDIPEGIGFNYISASMFSGTSLGGITLPSSITSIGDNAFYRCGYLLYANMTDAVASIGAQAFYQTSLSSFTIPANLSHLGSYAFFDCRSLKLVDFAPGCILSELPSAAFCNCLALKSISFPSSLVSIESSCFTKSGLATIHLPATLTYLGSYAFSQCDSLSAVTFDPSSQIMSIQAGTFQSDPALLSVNLPDSVRSIGNYAFQGDSSLSMIQIPHSLSSLGASAFQECTSLKTVVFKGDASKISSQSSTFYLCDKITTVVYMGKKSKSLNFFSSQPSIYYTISFYKNREAVEEAVPPLSYFILKANSVPADPKSGEVYLGSVPEPPGSQRWIFEDRGDGRSFTPTEEMTDSFYAYAHAAADPLSIGDTFIASTAEQVPVTYTVMAVADGSTPGAVTVASPNGTAMATTVTGAVSIPERVVGPDVQYYTVTEIGPAAFSGCSRFVTVTIPETVTAIGTAAFARCTALTNVNFASDASKIVDAGLFVGCANIKLVVFGGKKANISFGVSNPTVYYTVIYYDSKHDLEIDNRETTMVVKQRALLGSLEDDDIRSGGPVPELKLGFVWEFEEGFGLDIPLTDSCYVYADGIGFQVPIQVSGGTTSSTPCWFKITSLDEDSGTGTVSVGLGIDGVTAVFQAIKGTPIIPASVTDAEGTIYQVTSVSDYAFGSTSQFTACQYVNNISLPAGITSMGQYAFANCRGMLSIAIPSTIAQMGAYTFYSCERLASVSFDSGSSLTHLADSAFDNCAALYSIGLPSGLKTVGNAAFRNCRALTRIMLPDTVTTIGNDAFYWCSELQMIDFPVSLKSVGSNAYFYCYNVTTITFKGDASKVTFGRTPFFFRYDQNHMGSLSMVIFKDKKSNTVTDYIQSGSYSPSFLNEYGRTYYLYYTVSFYRRISDFNTNNWLSLATIREDQSASGAVPYIGAGIAWRVEPGFSFSDRTTDSYYAYGGYDISQAYVSGVNETYDYTGAYIKPIPILSMPDGTVLRQGIDYVFDSSVGLMQDGYANNRRMGTASIHILGVNDYAGSRVIDFDITGSLPAATVMHITFIGADSFTYDGSPKTPAVNVVISFRGQTTQAIEGTDYTLSYRDNIDANAKRGGSPAQVVVSGMKIYAGVATAPFNILAAPISRCDIKGKVTIDDEGTHPELTVSDTRIPTTLSYGNDYLLNTRRTTLGEAQVYLTGQGNYTGVVQLDAESSSGKNGGAGGGDGPGIGSDNGPASGRSDGTASSGLGNEGAQGTASSIGLSLDPTEAMLGEDTNPGAKSGGGGNGGKFAIFEIGAGDVEVIDDVTMPFPWMMLQVAILAALVLISGGTYRYRNFSTNLKTEETY